MDKMEIERRAYDEIAIANSMSYDRKSYMMLKKWVHAYMIACDYNPDLYYALNFDFFLSALGIIIVGKKSYARASWEFGFSIESLKAATRYLRSVYTPRSIRFFLG